MKTIRYAQFISVFFTGLFTGLMFTFMLVIQRVLATLSASEYTVIMQGLIRGADDPPVVPAIVMISMLAPLYTLIHLRKHRQSLVFKLTLAGLLVFVAGVFVITIGINAPINNQIVKWSVESPPANWMTLRDQWNNINWIRTPASGLSFVLFMLTLALPLPKTKPESL
jgi:uncharacterized membrane protein